MAVVLRSSPLLWARVAAMVFACVAFSVALYGGSLTHGTGDWCVFCWSFSFVGTLLIILVEMFGLQTRAPVSWKNFPITFACYASLLCLSAKRGNVASSQTPCLKPSSDVRIPSVRKQYNLFFPHRSLIQSTVNSINSDAESGPRIQEKEKG